MDTHKFTGAVFTEIEKLAAMGPVINQYYRRQRAAAVRASAGRPNTRKAWLSDIAKRKKVTRKSQADVLRFGRAMDKAPSVKVTDAARTAQKAGEKHMAGRMSRAGSRYEK